MTVWKRLKAAFSAFYSALWGEETVELPSAPPTEPANEPVVSPVPEPLPGPPPPPPPPPPQPSSLPPSGPPNLAFLTLASPAVPVTELPPSDDPFSMGLPTVGFSEPVLATVRTAEVLRPSATLLPDPPPPLDAVPELSFIPPSPSLALRPRNVGSPPESIWEDEQILEDVLRDLAFEVEDAVYPGVKRVIAVLEDALVRRRFDLAPFPAAAARMLGRNGPPPSDDEIIEVINFQQECCRDHQLPL